MAVDSLIRWSGGMGGMGGRFGGLCLRSGDGGVSAVLGLVELWKMWSL